MNGHPRVFERTIDLEGRVRLPDFLFDEYQTCYVSLGIFKRYMIQISPEAVHLLISDALENFQDSKGRPQVLSEELGDFYSRWHIGEHLKMDDVGRITIPSLVLSESGIRPGMEVVGHAGPPNKDYKPEGVEAFHPAYWTLEDKIRWLTENPSNQYILDYYDH